MNYQKLFNYMSKEHGVNLLEQDMQEICNIVNEENYNTATIVKNPHCKDCGWPIIHVCCNDTFQNFKDAGDWDWWMYCSNKGCKNHDGEGVFQSWPDWATSTPQ